MPIFSVKKQHIIINPSTFNELFGVRNNEKVRNFVLNNSKTQ